VIAWDAARIAAAAGARLVRGGHESTVVAEGTGSVGVAGSAEVAGSTGQGRELDGPPGPLRVTIDSRRVQPGDLFVGLPGERVDGGAYAEQALRAGAWGVLVGPPHAAEASAWIPPPAGAVLVHPDPLAGLQTLARAWRHALGAQVVGITGSTGKTSTKDILAALLARDPEIGPHVAASPENLNTEIGLPLAVLAAPPATKVLVLEMAMRGSGQIAELVDIAEPDVGVIVNVGPVHLELLGSLEAIAAAKAELIAGLRSGATIVIPAGEPLLRPHLRADLRTVTFGEGGEVELLRGAGEGAAGSAGEGAAGSAGEGAEGRSAGEVTIVDHASSGDRAERCIVVKPSFSQSHNLRNLLAAVAAARALGVTPSGKLDVAFSALRGERIALADGIVLINDCYNANPMSMRAALDDLAATAPARRVAVLGDMLELGSEQGPGLHREVAAYARARGVELLVTVGPQAAEMEEAFGREVHRVPDAAAAAELLPTLLCARDTVLVKGSRGIGLELVGETLTAAAGTPAPASDPDRSRGSG
jgi:UDP-N-acetylmuramoyl-tripeptide--D-alanyl-D-alanine ligase